MALPTSFRRAIPAGARVDRWQAADGWTLRRFDWPANAGRGSLLFQGGLGDFFEKYLEAFAHWHARGWNVTSFDWRGQGGSRRLDAPGDRDDFGGLVSDLEAFWTAWIEQTPGPHVLVGHSMGGHLVLRSLLAGAVRPEATVLVAPMLGLRFGLGPWLGERLARCLMRLGDPARPAWRFSRGPGGGAFRQRLLTHDDARYADERWWLKTCPNLRIGFPSWAWVVESFTSTRRQRADPRLATLDLPVLMLVADADRLVDPAASIRVARRLPRATLRRWGREARHELLREADPVRADALDAIETFLAEHAA